VDRRTGRCGDAVTQDVCEVPGCESAGMCVVVAAADGWFAAKLRRIGDEIRLCHAHLHDVHHAQGVYHAYQLPEWLRVDVLRNRVGWGRE
jgi:hypothetical protein